MSEPADTRSEKWGWLPTALRPLEREHTGRGELRLIETTVLVIIGVILAIATVNDVVRQTHTNHRLVADLRTWRTVTGHDYKNVGVEQDIKTFTTRDIPCGNVSPGAPESVSRICLILTGPVRHGMRTVAGGYYLPAYVQDLRKSRYGCFGIAESEDLCGAPIPAGAPQLKLKEG